MRNGQNKRMRGRNRKSGHHQNPLSRVYEFKRAGRENSRNGVSCCGKISAACPGCAELRRPSRGRELLPARRALLPSDCSGAGAVSPKPALLPTVGRSTGQSSRRWVRRRRRRAAFHQRRTVRAARTAAVLFARATAAAITAAASAPAPAARSADQRGGCGPAAVIHHRRPTATAATARRFRP